MMPPEKSRLHRGMEIALGLFLLIVLLLCIGGAIGLIIMPHEKQPERGAVGVILLLACLWGVSVSIQLIRGQYRYLLSPRALRLASWLFIIMPVGGLFTGALREKPLPTLLGAFCHLCFFFSIRSLAAERENPKPSELDISNLQPLVGSYVGIALFTLLTRNDLGELILPAKK